MKQYWALIFIAPLIGSSFSAAANDGSIATKDYEFVATVNGAPISKGLFDLNLQGVIAQGQKDTPQLRDNIRNDLINKQLIAQEVVKEGLDKDIDLTNQMAQLRLNLYLQAYIEAYLKENPITDAKLHQEYDKQKEALGGGDSTMQYKLSQITLGTESEAIAVIDRLEKGESFAKVAKQVSTDAQTRSQGGLIGWVAPQQLDPAIASNVISLGKSGFNKTPLKMGNLWVIFKVEDTRSNKIASYESSKNGLRQAIIQQYLQETIKRLRESARIVQ